MNRILLVIALISSSLPAMDLFEEESDDVRIDLGGEKKESKNKRAKVHKRNGSFDIELQDIEPRGDYHSSYHVDKQKYIQNLLLELPIFRGKKQEEISKRMGHIEKMLPKEYGEITESISISYNGFKKRLRTRGITDIDPNEISGINTRILNALLEATLENQEIAATNRELDLTHRDEDLAQAASDRRCSIFTFIAGFVVSIPALTLAIINIAAKLK